MKIQGNILTANHHKARSDPRFQRSRFFQVHVTWLLI